ncbi:hypothetical protein RPIT_06055 [Tessaracoccus flavus]|uniref:Uncharacterized protein n=1 Tax=Tessaracoccus flavus TaxID=1610493 RepID=A0A1Q2CE80_9ACTN|nr:hypothetical protein RPIT_06055 [Tessaracoccus flavus]
MFPLGSCAIGSPTPTTYSEPSSVIWARPRTWKGVSCTWTGWASAVVDEVVDAPDSDRHTVLRFDGHRRRVVEVPTLASAGP